MKSNVEKSVKRWLKRKVSITLGMMVAFLISGVVTFSEDIEIKYENGEFVVSSKENGDVYKPILNNPENFYQNDGIVNGKINFNGELNGQKLIILNTGIVSSKKSQFSEKEVITQSFNNYGITVGDYTNISNKNEYGLHIVDNGNITVTTGNLFDGKNYGKVEFFDNKGGLSKSIVINGVTEGLNEAKALNSDDIKKIIEEMGDSFFSDLIINVVGDQKEGKYNSLIVGNNFGIGNSTINGYRVAIKFDDNNTFNSFNGDGVTINGGEYSFLGSAGKDKINLGYLNLNTVNGDIDLKEGDDEINISKTKINGNIDFGTGNDSLIAKDSTIKGNINFGDNANITINNNVTIDGKITVNGDTTNLTLGKDATLGGNTTFDIQSKNKNLILGYNINNESDIKSMKEQVENDKLKEFVIKLADGGNSNVNLEGVKINTSITGGNGDDVFIIGQNETGIEINDVSNSDNDTLKLSFNTTERTELNGGYENIENLQLKLTGKNILDVEGLNFKSIKGGNEDDTFNNVTENNILAINGGWGEDTINTKAGVKLNNSQVDTSFTTNSIEKLNLTGDNNVSLDDLSHTSKINFGTGNNTLILGTENSGIEFDFTQKNLINGNVGIDLNQNTGMLESTFANNTVTLDSSFTNGKVTFTNGTIKFGLGDTTFENGIESNYTLVTNNLIGEGITLKTYAFLNINKDNENLTLTVKDWEELIKDLGEGYDKDKAGKYEGALKDYNQEGKDALTGAFNSWNEKEIADYIENGEMHDYFTPEDNSDKTYEHLIVNKDLTIDTSTGGAINNLTFNALSATNLIVKGSDIGGNNTINFKGTTKIDNINAKDFNNLTLDFNTTEGTGIELGNVAFGTEGNKLNIDNSSKVNNIGTISGNVDITIETANTDNNSEGFNKILAGANAGLNEGKNTITVTNKTDVEITKNYGGTLTFKGEGNNITLGSTIGNLVMGDGDDNINLDTSKFTNNIAVNVDGGIGNNIFDIGSPASTLENNDINQKLDGKTLTGTINSFKNINVNESINFASDLKLNGTSQISIGQDKNLGLDVDYSKTQDGKVIGHALYNNGITVDNTNGKLVIGTADAKKDATISMGTSSITNGDNVVTSGSINHEVKYDKEKNEIEVIVKDSIVDGNDKIKYASLEKIHQSIVNAGKIDLMRLTGDIQRGDRTEDEAIKAQLEFYGKIYTSTPYAYSNDISRETVNMVNDSIMDSRFKADEGKWLHYGAIAGQGYDDDNSYYGRGYYNSVDLGTTEVNVKSDIYSAYYMGEYGKTDKLALGYVIAGNNSNTNIGESKLDGSGYYLGTYAKYNTGNLKLVAGLGYQHNYYKADRKVSNEYQSMAVEKKYTDNTLTAYSGVRYIHNLAEDLTVEPYARLSLTHVMQDDIKEADRGDLSISVDGKDFTTIESEVGVDLVKSANVKDGKVNLIAGVGAEFMLDGYERENLTAKINGSTSSFDIISDKEENFRGKVSLGVEYEKTNGVFYNAKGSYIRTEDNNNYKFEVGIGYKF